MYFFQIVKHERSEAAFSDVLFDVVGNLGIKVTAHNMSSPIMPAKTCSVASMPIVLRMVSKKKGSAIVKTELPAVTRPLTSPKRLRK